MIHTIRTVAVGDQESKIDSPIILYRGDREVEVEFTINGSKFTFTNGGNVIKSTNATHGQLVINTPTGENMFSEVTECHDGKVVFVITKEMIDELIEVGFYSFQIRLFDESQVSRVTIPPVLKGIDIRNPIAAEDETNVVDIGLVDYAVVVKDEFEDLSTFLPDGNYNKTEWESKDVISGARLNKIEDALYNINSNMEATDLALLNRVENSRLDANGRLNALESVNADSRLDALESVNADSRLDTLENVNADSRLDTLEEQVPDLYNNLPYAEYTRDKSVDFDGTYKHYQGFSNHSKKTYGRYENATVMSVIANTDNPTPAVLGTDTLGLATYTNRDSVSLYTANFGKGPVLTIQEGVTYTENSAIIPEDANIDMDMIKVGMIVDVGENVNRDWCVGIISKINNRELIMEDGFYLVRNDGVTPTRTTPSDGTIIRIQMTNKVWVINSNLFIDPGCPAGANMELGVLANHTSINDVGGIDIINMRQQTHYGVKVRGATHSFNEGYVSSGNGVHFVGKQTDPYTPLLRGIDDNGRIFDISTSGIISKQAYATYVFSSSGDIADNVGVAFIAGNDINLHLPLASDHPGRIIEIVTIGTGSLLTAKSGNGILTPDLNQQQVSIARYEGKRMRSVRFVSDGGNMWYQLSDLY